MHQSVNMRKTNVTVRRAFHQQQRNSPYEAFTDRLPQIYKIFHIFLRPYSRYNLLDFLHFLFPTIIAIHPYGNTVARVSQGRPEVVANKRANDSSSLAGVCDADEIQVPK